MLKPIAYAALLTLLLAGLPAVGAAAAQARPAGPVTLSAAEADSLRIAIQRNRAETLEWLKSGANSYLATVQRVDFGARTTLNVGSAADADVRIADPAVAARHLAVTVAGDSFRVAGLEPGATFRLGGADTRAATLGPSGIGLGRFTLRLSHQRFPAIIVFDPESPRFRDYKPLEWFPVDPACRYVLELTPNPKADTVIILSTRGNRRRAVRVGWFDFQVGRRKCRLHATRLLEPGIGEQDISVLFRDATTGRESYGVGRYVDPERLPDGRFLLDFNLAYNPACAVSEHYNCPIPPRENVLKVAIRAGEKDAHYH
jgi:uncharacterized protein (DUF1684 family)